MARAWLEAGMATHMLVQMPLLLVLGVWMSRSVPEVTRDRWLWRVGGPLVPVLLALFTLSYWMLPRALDSALSHASYEIGKFLTLPLLAGLPLGLAWPQLGVLGRGFFWANLCSMLAVVAWLYIAAPVRICNQYLVDDQTEAGRWMLWVAGLLFFLWLADLFRKRPRVLDSSSADV